MKKQSLCRRLGSMIRTLLQFSAHHMECLEAMERTYHRQWRDAESNNHHAIRLTASPYGSIYLVTMAHFINGDFDSQESWLATYGWHSNGHLMGIGTDRFLIYNPQYRVLYLMEYKKDWSIPVDTYEQV